MQGREDGGGQGRQAAGHPDGQDGHPEGALGDPGCQGGHDGLVTLQGHGQQGEHGGCDLGFRTMGGSRRAVTLVVVVGLKTDHE